MVCGIARGNRQVPHWKPGKTIVYADPWAASAFEDPLPRAYEVCVVSRILRRYDHCGQVDGHGQSGVPFVPALTPITALEETGGIRDGESRVAVGKVGGEGDFVNVGICQSLRFLHPVFAAIR
jgi:hypothetical protein